MARQKHVPNECPATDAPGITLEKVVARIQQMMEPNSLVTHNEKPKDRVGNIRQYDVVFRGYFGGRPVLGVMECKDHSRRKGPDVVEAFAKKTENLGANLRIIVSKKGFTEQALRLAKHESIGCISLLPSDPSQVGFSIGNFWYGRISRWEAVRLIVHFADQVAPLDHLESDKVRFEGKPVILWFLRELFKKDMKDIDDEEHSFHVMFDCKRQVEISGTLYNVSGLSCSARHVKQKKRIWVHWSGDAFYDWHTGRFTIPAAGTVVGSSVRTDLATWPDFEGEIPDLIADAPLPGLMTAVVFNEQQWPQDRDDEVPDLRAL